MSLSDHWKRKRAAAAAVANSGRVKFTYDRGRVHVACPESDLFSRRARELGGKYRDRANVWSFPLVSQRLVKSLAAECFGEENITQ